MKQRITAIAAKVRRYQSWVYRQNGLPENNQRQFYRALDQEEERCDDDQPVAEEPKSFGETSGVSMQIIRRMQNGNKTCEMKIMFKKQEKVDNTTGSLKKILGRMPNWKSLCPDLVQGFWLKNFGSLHERVRLKLKECLESGFLPGWLTRGRTSLLQKDKSKCNAASIYRPITCLPLMWKLLTGVIADQIYVHLDHENCY